MPHGHSSEREMLSELEAAFQFPEDSQTWGLNPAFSAGIFPGRVIPVAEKLALQWLPCHAPGDIGSALGMAGPVSEYCDWVRKKV